VITVNPRPLITSMTAVSCEGLTFEVSPVQTTNGTVPAGTLYSWSLPTVSDGMTGGANGSNAVSITGNLSNPTSGLQTAVYTVTTSSPAGLGGCSGGTFTLTVTVNPNAAITLMSTTINTGSTFRVTPTDVTNGQVPTAPVGPTTNPW